MNRVVSPENLSALKAEPIAIQTYNGEFPRPLQPLEFDYAQKLKASLPQIMTCGKRWLVHLDGCWRDVKRDTFRPKAHEVMPHYERTTRRANTLLDHLEDICQVDERILRSAIAFDDSGAVLVNTLSGIVRVQQSAIDLLPHNPELHFTQCLNAQFDAQADCKLFAYTLRQCLPDEEDQTLFRLCCGNFLYPDCRFEVALVCYGEAGRGKSTVAEPIASVVGDGLLTRLSMSQICDPKSYSLAKLRHAAVNLGTELDSLEVGESGNFKTLVSGEPIEARPIYSEPFTMHTHCKLWFLANGLPRFKNGTEAELRRTRFLRFDYKPDQPDVTLKDRLAAERSGVLNFMLSGLQELLSRSSIPLGGQHSRAVHERFKVSNDPIGAFLAQHCHLTPEGRTRKESLCEAFSEFCEQQNLSATFKDHFLRKLYERCPQLQESRPRVGTDRVRFVEGIQLKAGAMD